MNLKHFVIAAAGTSLAIIPRASVTYDCSDHRGFDAWVGEWEVYRNGAKAGTQSVKHVIDGCVILAEWSGTAGDRGLSVISFDETANGWTQLWTANNKPYKSRPTLRRQDTAFTGPGIRLVRVSDSHTPPGETDRLTTTVLSADRVRQVLEASRDGGKTWNVIFDVEQRRR